MEMKPFVISDVAQIDSNQRETNEILYVQKKVYSLLPFLNYYNLNIIAGSFIMMMAGGIILLIYVKKVQK